MKYYLTLILVATSAFGEYREITNKTGQAISARILSFEDGQVKLECSDRTIFTIPLNNLSHSEIEKIKEEFAESEVQKEEVATSEADALREELNEKYPINEKMSEASEAFRQAFNYQKSKDSERAIEIWASIPKKREQYADSRRRAGYNVLGRELGRWNEAVLFLLDAYEADPKNRDVLEDLGRAYLRIDDYENAKVYLKKAKTKNARKALEELKEMEG